MASVAAAGFAGRHSSPSFGRVGRGGGRGGLRAQAPPARSSRPSQGSETFGVGSDSETKVMSRRRQAPARAMPSGNNLPASGRSNSPQSEQLNIFR
jgi:hypothetical protein